MIATDSDSPFLDELIEEGFHVFSLEKAKIPGYYPTEFPDYPGVKLSSLSIGDQV